MSKSDVLKVGDLAWVQFEERVEDLCDCCGTVLAVDEDGLLLSARSNVWVQDEVVPVTGPTSPAAIEAAAEAAAQERERQALLDSLR